MRRLTILCVLGLVALIPLAHAGELQGLNDLVAAIGGSVSLGSTKGRSEITVIFNQHELLDAVPNMQSIGILNEEISKTYIQMHPNTLSVVAAIQLATISTIWVFQNTNIDKIKMTMTIDRPDLYGHSIKTPMFSFDFDRALYKRVNWNEFKVKNFPVVAPHFKLDESFSQDVAAEG